MKSDMSESFYGNPVLGDQVEGKAFRAEVELPIDEAFWLSLKLCGSQDAPASSIEVKETGVKKPKSET